MDIDIELERAFMSLPPEKRADILRYLAKETMKVIPGGQIDRVPAPTVKPTLRVIKSGAK